MTTADPEQAYAFRKERFILDSVKTTPGTTPELSRQLSEHAAKSSQLKSSKILENPRKRSECLTPHDTFSKRKENSDEGHSDNSETSANSKQFIKLNARGKRDEAPFKAWADDLNHIFLEDKSKFVGEFITDKYKVLRGYINGVGTQLRLYYTKLEPLGKKIASLCIIHGLGEHSGRFINLADYFVQKGYIVHMIDLRGFGHSGYSRANASVEELHKDIEVLLRQASRDLPLFVYGHSMGAGLVASLLIRNPYLNISGVIFSSAMFQFHKDRKFSWKKKLFLRLLGDEFEEVVLNCLVNPTGLTTNNYEIKKLFDDKLCSNIVGMKLAKNLIDMTEWIIPKASRFRYPCLIIHGKEDTFTDYEASIRFFQKISRQVLYLFSNLASEVKVVKIFEDGLHEIHHDHGKDVFQSLITNFLEERMKASPKPIGEFQPLKVGLKVKGVFEKYRTLTYILLGIVYVFFLRQFRGHKLYNNKVKLFLYPIFYIFNVLMKRHTLAVKLR